MKQRIFRNFLLPASLLVLVGLMLAGSPDTAAAQTNVGPDFLYQGYLEENGNPVNGTCTFAFRLFDSPTGGNQLGVTQSVLGVTVTEGSFAVTLNEGNEFGDDAFNGQARWLEIVVGCGDDHITLSPRQELLAVPYALGLRPGTTISGTVPIDNGVLNLVGGDYGLRVSSTDSDGIVIDSPGGHGIRVLQANEDGVHTTSAGNYGGYFFGGAGGVLASAGTAAGPDVVLGGYTDGGGDVQADGRIATSDLSQDSSMYLLSNHDVTVRLDADGGPSPSSFTVAEGTENGDDDVTHLQVNEEGVEAQRFFVQGVVGGVSSFPPSGAIFFNADTSGVYARSVSDSSPDLIVSGSGPGNRANVIADDGVISSDPDFPSSDIILSSNDTVRVDLDVNADGEDADFEVRNSSNDILLDVDSRGNVGIGTESPDHRLVVQGNNPVVQIRDDTVDNSPNAARLDLLERAGGTFNGGAYLRWNGQSNQLLIGTQNGGSDTTVLAVDRATSRVGIGTTSPLSNLHVSSGDLAELRLTATSPANDVQMFIDARGDGTDRGQLGTLSNHDVVMFANSRALIVLGRDGSVCIGNC
jgi:hypothetical protein